MPLAIKEELTRGVTILRLSGNLDDEESALNLRAHLLGLIATGRTTLLLDMERIETFDMRGLGTLIGFEPRLAQLPGGRRYLNILNPSKAVLNLDDRPGHFFGVHLPVYRDEEDAIRQIGRNTTSDNGR